MKQIILAILFLFSNILRSHSQNYFPSNDSEIWDTIPISNMNWCEEKINLFYNFLDANNTKAFILLKDGKIVLEKYFNGHTANSNWYWASSGKAITAFLTGVAQEEGFLQLTDKTSQYLGQGWTNCTQAQEQLITIWHQLTMTTGLNDQLNDPFCTDDSCLNYLTNPGNRWAYHNAPYTLLSKVIEYATGQSLNTYLNAKLKVETGMNGSFIQQDYNHVYFSTARSMARFALLILNKGNWNGTQIMSDSNYFNQSINTSQNLNLSYGYLWWLNGKDSHMIPQSQFVFNGSVSPSAPQDMFAAMGKNGQLINIVPSQNMAWIRMGNSTENGLVSFGLNQDIWQYINEFSCDSTLSEDSKKLPTDHTIVKLSPNPADNYLIVQTHEKFDDMMILNQEGKTLFKSHFQKEIDLSSLKSGAYILKLFGNSLERSYMFIKK